MARVLDPEPCILREEVGAALKKLKIHKFPGIMHYYVTQHDELDWSSWNMSIWSDDWTTFIHIHKNRRYSRWTKRTIQ